MLMIMSWEKTADPQPVKRCFTQSADFTHSKYHWSHIISLPNTSCHTGCVEHSCSSRKGLVHNQLINLTENQAGFGQSEAVHWRWWSASWGGREDFTSDLMKGVKQVTYCHEARQRLLSTIWQNVQLLTQLKKAPCNHSSIFIMTYSAHCDHANTWHRHSAPVGLLLSCTDTNFTSKMISQSQQNSCGSSSGHVEDFKVAWEKISLKDEHYNSMSNEIYSIIYTQRPRVPVEKNKQGNVRVHCPAGGANAIGKWRCHKWMYLIHNGGWVVCVKDPRFPSRPL